MQSLTTIIDYAYQGTMGGRKYEGVAQSTEHWQVPDGPVDKGAMLAMHKQVWMARMLRENGVKVDPTSVRVTNTQFLI